MKTDLCILAVAIAFAPFEAQSAAIPFSEDFNIYDNVGNPSVTPAGFTETVSADWSVQNDGAGKDYQYSATRTTLSNQITFFTSASRLTLTNAVGTNFKLSTKLTIDAASSTTSSYSAYAGVVFLGVSSTVGYAAEVIVSGSAAGSIQLVKDATVVASDNTGSFSLSTPYTLSLSATYAGASNLTLDFTVSDGTTSRTISFTDTTPANGQLFGFRNREDVFFPTGGAITTVNVDYDNLIIVPEPSTVALITVGFSIYASRRQKPLSKART